MPLRYLFRSVALVSAGLLWGLAPSSRGDEIHTLVQQGNLDQVKKILAKNPKAAAAPDKKNNNLTPLHYAVSGAQKPILDELLKHKPDVNAKSADGDTPLHLAAWNGHYQLVGTLLDAGADPNLPDGSGQSALYAAAWSGHLTS